jgi:acyl-CoA reductase-like NAD-dependent aldehyde dehydrogenase
MPSTMNCAASSAISVRPARHQPVIVLLVVRVAIVTAEPATAVRVVTADSH